MSCGILVTNYSITSLCATFLHDADSYALAFLLVVLGMYCSISNKKIISIILYVFSLGLYQAYIQVAIFSFLIIAFKRTIESDDYQTEIKNLLNNFIPIIISMLLYFIIHKIVIIVFGIAEPNTYNSISNAWDFSLSAIHSKIYNAIRAEIKWLFFPNNYRSLLICAINILLLFITFFKIISVCKHKKIKKTSMLFIFFIVLVMPIGINAIGFISGADHDLTIFSFFLFYLFFFTIISLQGEILKNFHTLGNSKIPVVSIILCAILILDNIIYSNATYTKKDFETKATLSVMTRIIDRIEQTDGYVPNVSKIAFIGSLDLSPITKERKYFSTHELSGATTNYAVTFYRTYSVYLNSYLGYSALLEDEKEIGRLENDEQIKNMPSFPANGCCQMIGNTIVFKLSPPDITEYPSYDRKITQKLLPYIREYYGF